jgi:MIP family channel proteins
LNEIPLARRCLAEFFGTYFLLIAGCGAIVINDVAGGSITHPGIALSFGLIVMAMIYAIGDVSGAHINPAVTLAFWFGKRFPQREVVPYIASQFAGGVAASATLNALFEHKTLGATIPRDKFVYESLVLEVILTAMLLYVILGVSTGSKEKGVLAGIAIGGTIALEAMFAGPICGASMNPVRSLSPALVSGNLADQWIYIVGPIGGALLGVLMARVTIDAPSTESDEAK